MLLVPQWRCFSNAVLIRHIQELQNRAITKQLQLTVHCAG